jgi:hypothetical protein
MHYYQQIILKRWLPILKEYERTKAKVHKANIMISLKALQQKGFEEPC